MSKSMIKNVKAPASKSMSHRLIMAAAMAVGQSSIHNVLESEDLFKTMEILRLAGAKIEQVEQGVYSIEGSELLGKDDFNEPLYCDVHESGTTCRLLTAILAAGYGYFYIYGSPRMSERPIGTLTTCLEKLGAKFQFENKNYPPFILFANGLKGGEITISLEDSSQYLSGLLLAAPLAESPLTIFIGGRHVVSAPYIGLTLQAMKAFGAQFDVCLLDNEKSSPEKKVWKLIDWKSLEEIVPGEIRFRIRPFKQEDSKPKGYKAGKHTVESDWSSASYLLAAGALGKNPVCVNGLNRHSFQPDKYLIEILKLMKAKVDFGNAMNNDVTVYPSHLEGIEINMSDCPDIVPTVAVLASFAHGQTKISGVEHLRIKESDRLSAIATELKKAGIKVEEQEDGLIIYGLHPEKPLSQAQKIKLEQNKQDLEKIEQTENKEEVKDVEAVNDELASAELKSETQIEDLDFSDKELYFNAHKDHRLAMSLSLFQVAGAKVHFDDPGVVEKSFPNFWQIWEEICS